jgi:hypothetical protein
LKLLDWTSEPIRAPVLGPALIPCQPINAKPFLDGNQIAEIPTLELMAGNPYQGFRLSLTQADSGQLVFDQHTVTVVLIPQHNEMRIGRFPATKLSRQAFFEILLTFEDHATKGQIGRQQSW